MASRNPVGGQLKWAAHSRQFAPRPSAASTGQHAPNGADVLGGGRMAGTAARRRTHNPLPRNASTAALRRHHSRGLALHGSSVVSPTPHSHHFWS